MPNSHILTSQIQQILIKTKNPRAKKTLLSIESHQLQLKKTQTSKNPESKSHLYVNSQQKKEKRLQKSILLRVEIEGEESYGSDQLIKHPRHGDEGDRSVDKKPERMELSPAGDPEI